MVVISIKKYNKNNVESDKVYVNKLQSLVYLYKYDIKNALTIVFNIKNFKQSMIR